MKIIDLLNKIANGEELPKTIYYRGDVWYLEQKFSNRLAYYKNGYNGDNLLTGKEKDYFSHSLNDEVEILEEEKKIPEKLEDRARFQYSEIPTWLDKKEIIKTINKNFEKHQKAIYEIIDCLKSKGDE